MALPDLVKFVWNHPLNSSGRIAALGRVARWQMASRLVSGPIAVPFVEGTSLFLSRGMTGATGNWYVGLHELPDMAFVLHALRRGERFLDVGANVGSYTVLAAGGPGALVTSVEPIPGTFAHLQRNIALNGLSGTVIAWQGGLSDSAGTLRFTTDLDAVNHVLREGEREAAVDIAVRTLDDLVGVNVPTLIKIDVEGYERPVLIGATRTLADSRLLGVVIETNGYGARYGVADDELMTLMAGNGFAPFTYDPLERRLVQPVSRGGNTIFVRDTETVAGRLRTAKRYRLVNGEI